MAADKGDTEGTARRAAAPAATRRGRPPQMDQETRRAQILSAAQQLLNSAPFDSVHMDAIAVEAGMSKRTLYDLFDNRNALLGEAISEMGRGIFRSLAPEERALPLADRLNILLTLNVPPEAEIKKIDFLRAIIAKVDLYHDIAQSMCRNGRDALRANLTRELERAAGAGEIVLTEGTITEAAEMLCDMAFHNPMERLLDPAAAAPSPAEVRARRDMAIRVFLRGCGAG
ncbi:TetR/AcrR family transcriptional regulator [Primorskyibacter flagellatus]|nr:TetR/AcrR family transcriptional regulator [Primorskyibacter flagellatus]